MPRTRRFIQAPTPALSDRKVKPATLWIMGGSFHGIKTKEKDQRSKDSQLDYFSNLLSYCISFLFFWLCWVFVAVHRLSLVVMSGGYSAAVCGLFLLRSMGFKCAGFGGCSSIAWAQWSWHTIIVAPRHAVSSQTRDWMLVPCIGRWILNHWTTKEVPHIVFHYQLSNLAESIK